MIQSLLGLGLFGLLLAAVIRCLPVVLIARPDNTYGGEKPVSCPVNKVHISEAGRSCGPC